jgi:hypothetical protein
MATPYCYVCEQQTAMLGQPSHARWKGPDGKAYCSMHFVQRFGHGEKLVRIDGYEPPTERKPPAPRRAKREKTTKETIEA